MQQRNALFRVGTIDTYIESSWSSHGEASRHARPGPHVSHRLYLRNKTGSDSEKSAALRIPQLEAHFRNLIT
jgi:hypothetical protein